MIANFHSILISPTFQSHVFNHIQALRHIRPALKVDIIKTIKYSLVGCHLDYANSILFRTSAKNIGWLHLNPKHSGINHYATTWTNQHHKDIQGPTLAYCQVPHRLQGGNTYKVLQSSEPSYLSSIINIDAPHRALRSSVNNQRLTVFQSKTKLFPSLPHILLRTSGTVCQLPTDIRNATSVPSFKNL